MTEKPDDVGLAEALVALSHHVLHLFTEVGRSYQLSRQQVELICAVIVRGRVRMSDLGRLLHVEKTGLSNLVDRIEQRGLATRTRDADDRRVTWVELTDEGSRLAMQTHADVTERLNQLITRLNVQDQRRLAAVAQQILGAGQAAGQRLTPRPGRRGGPAGPPA